MIFRSIRRLAALLLALCASVAFAAVDANTGTQADLDGIKGVGPAIAGRIVAERAKGPYKDWGDLVSRVKGIGDKSASKLSTAGLTVNGQAYAGAPAATTATKAAPKSTPAGAAATPTAAATPPPLAASAPTATSAADKKAARKAEREEKKAAKAAAVDQARQSRMAKPASAASGAMR